MLNHMGFDRGTSRFLANCSHQELVVAHLIEMHHYLIQEELMKHH